MKMTYDEEADALLIRLVNDEAMESRYSHDEELPMGDAAVALDGAGAILEIELLNASRKYPLEMLHRLPMTGDEDEALPLAQAAKIAGVGLRALQKAIERGRLDGKKIGRNWTTTTSALTVYLNGRKHHGPTSKTAV